MGLSKRLILTLIGLAAAITGAVVFVAARVSDQALLAQALHQLERQAVFMAGEVDGALARLRGDLSVLRSTDAVVGLVDSATGAGVDRQFGLSHDQWRHRVASRLVAEINAKPDHLRFAVADGRNRDIVRVERIGSDGRAQIVPDVELGEAGQRTYVVASTADRNPAVPASAVAFERNAADPSGSAIPVMNVAVAVASKGGEPFGLLRAGLDLGSVLARLRSADVGVARVFVFDQHVAYLVQSQAAGKTESRPGRATRLQDEFPSLAADFTTGQEPARLVADRAGRTYGFAAASAGSVGAERLMVGVAVPRDLFASPADQIWQIGVMVGLAAMIAAVGLAIWIAASMKRPLVQMTAAVEAFGRGMAPAIPVNAGGEIGKLARAFGRMAELIDDKSAAARRSSELLDKTLASMSDGVLVLDPTGRTLFANPACKAMFGDRFEIGSPEWQAHYARFRSDGVTPCPPEQSPIGRAVRGESFDNFEVVCRRMDSGDTIRIVASGRVIRSPKGRYDGAVIVYRDVTELTEKTVAIRRNAEIFSSIMASMADAVLLVDEKCRVVFANRVAGELLGEKASCGIGEWAEAFEIYLPDGTTPIPLSDWPVMRAVKGENVDNFGMAVRGIAPGRLVQLVLTARPLEHDSGGPRGAVVVFRDVTKLEEIERQLRHSQKMDAIGQLTGGVAHDFNNILTVITGTIEILADGVADRPKLLAIARLIDEAATRGSSLTQQLLAFARRQALQPRRTDVNAMVVETTRLLRPTLGEAIEIRAMLGADVCPADIDPSQLSTALLNLAVNARDAMPSGGKLTIETANVVLDDAYGRDNPDVRPGVYVMIAVSDTGMGIPAAIVDNVFEPFFTTKEPGKGTGLGLSMVYGFVKQSEGHIKLYSEEGHGTTIKLYLPRSDQPEPRPSAAVPDSTLGNGETILVVEDDDMVRTYVVAQLASIGYSTLAAANGAAALALVDSGATFDLLFTDVIMPGGMNGRQLADEIGIRRPGTKVLFTSGYTENAVVHHGRLDPGITMLAKPYRKAELARKVRDVLEGGS